MKFLDLSCLFRPPAKQNLAKMKNSDNHGHKLLALLSKIGDFQNFLTILSADISKTKARNRFLSIVPVRLATRLLKATGMVSFPFKT